MNGPAGVLPVLRPEIVRRENVCPDGEPDEHVDDEVGQECRRPDRRHCLRRREASEHNQIRRIEHQLKNSGKNERDGKKDDLAEDRPAAHVDTVFVALHKISFVRYYNTEAGKCNVHQADLQNRFSVLYCRDEPHP